ncbi:hypothetical protein Pelo_2902 [Pelomyxa schiedti]|nr:hypothetical protein Pelo_2902 [Pelomyxa schiedti]
MQQPLQTAMPPPPLPMPVLSQLPQLPPVSATPQVLAQAAANPPYSSLLKPNPPAHMTTNIPQQQKSNMMPPGMAMPPPMPVVGQKVSTQAQAMQQIHESGLSQQMQSNLLGFQHQALEIIRSHQQVQKPSAGDQLQALISQVATHQRSQELQEPVHMQATFPPELHCAVTSESPKTVPQKRNAAPSCANSLDVSSKRPRMGETLPSEQRIKVSPKREPVILEKQLPLPLQTVSNTSITSPINVDVSSKRPVVGDILPSEQQAVSPRREVQLVSNASPAVVNTPIGPPTTQPLSLWTSSKRIPSKHRKAHQTVQPPVEPQNPISSTPVPSMPPISPVVPATSSPPNEPPPPQSCTLPPTPTSVLPPPLQTPTLPSTRTQLLPSTPPTPTPTPQPPALSPVPVPTTHIQLLPPQSPPPQSATTNATTATVSTTQATPRRVGLKEFLMKARIKTENTAATQPANSPQRQPRCPQQPQQPQQPRVDDSLCTNQQRVDT